MTEERHARDQWIESVPEAWAGPRFRSSHIIDSSVLKGLAPAKLAGAIQNKLAKPNIRVVSLTLFEPTVQDRAAGIEWVAAEVAGVDQPDDPDEEARRKEYWEAAMAAAVFEVVNDLRAQTP